MLHPHPAVCHQHDPQLHLCIVREMAQERILPRARRAPSDHVRRSFRSREGGETRVMNIRCSSRGTLSSEAVIRACEVASVHLSLKNWSMGYGATRLRCSTGFRMTGCGHDVSNNMTVHLKMCGSSRYHLRFCQISATMSHSSPTSHSPLKTPWTGH